jgi:hypothetical protein
MCFEQIIETSTKFYIGEVEKGNIERFQIYLQNKYYEMVALAIFFSWNVFPQYLEPNICGEIRLSPNHL